MSKSWHREQKRLARHVKPSPPPKPRNRYERMVANRKRRAK